jgi:hypothetical protein
MRAELMTPWELDKALLNPGSAVGSPEKVAENLELSRDRKIHILLRWEYDAAEAAVALEDGMSGQGRDFLRRILVEPARLGAAPDIDMRPIQARWHRAHWWCGAEMPSWTRRV